MDSSTLRTVAMGFFLVNIISAIYVAVNIKAFV